MANGSAEYQALERVITADKRYRRFQYALTSALFIIALAGIVSVQQSITHKIDGLVSGAVARNDARQKESKTISEETTRYITCIFVVPIEKRTPEVQESCFKAADLPGGLTRNDFSPILVTPDGTVSVATAAQGQSSPASVSPTSSASSSNSTPQSPPAQSNPVQETPPAPQSTVLDRIPVVGGLFKALGL